MKELDACVPSSAEHKEWHNAAMNFKSEMSYGDYLSLDTVLDAQKPLSPEHNELLFIIQHQTSELWMKLALNELHASRRNIIQDNVQSAFKMLTRVSRILDQLVQAWSVLTTMTPSEYSGMRPYLGMSSGFQSYQYREIEFLLGNKNKALLGPHAHRPAILQRLTDVLQSPSIYDEALRLLQRRGLPIEKRCLERDWSESREPDASVEAAWLEVYRDPQRYWDLYQLGEKLVDMEDSLRQWRFRHVTTVERVIGFKTGTGGTAGVSYLRKMLEITLFPELWKIRTML